MGTNSNDTTTIQTGGTTKGNNNPATEGPGVLAKGGGAGTSSAGDKDGDPDKKKKGDPVSVATGAVTESALDLVLPGAIAMLFSRSYSSFDAGKSTPLGRSGWTHSFHQWIELDGDSFIHVGPALARQRYPKLGPQQAAFHRATRTTLTHRMDGIFELHSLDLRMTRDFAPLVAGARSVLRAVRDAWGNRISLMYENGQLATIVDTAGREVRVRRDGAGRIGALEVWAQDRVHKTLRYHYTDDGDLAAFTDPLGHVTRYAYDGKHRLVRKTLPTDLSFHYEYDPDSGRCVKSWGDRNLQKVEFAYDTVKKTTTSHGEREPRVFFWDDKGQILREESFDGSYVEAYEYDADGLCTAQENAAGQRVETTYDERGAPTKTVDAAGNETLLEYHNDQCVRRVRADGRADAYSYDAKGAITGVRFSDGQEFAFEHDEFGHIVALYGAGVTIIRREFDSQHNVVREIDARGAEWRYTYDPLGRPAERLNPLGAVLRRTVNAVDNVVEMQYSDGTREEYAYDALGNVIRAVQRDGLVLQRRYAGRRLVEQVGPDGGVWRFEYDRMERLIAVVNPKAERYEFRYDRMGRVVEETTFDGRVMTYGYSRGDRLSRIEYPDGAWRQFTYDALGKLIQEDTADGPAIFKRDRFGRILEATLEDGPVTTSVKYELDPLGRVVRETQGGQTITYEYNLRGRTASRTMPRGQRTEYEYDALSTPVKIVHDGNVLRLERDLTGKEVRRSVFDGAVDIETSWDLDERIVGRAVSAPQPGGHLPRLLSQRTWEYTATNRLLAENDAVQGRTTFEHSPVRDLVSQASKSISEQFRYDAGGSVIEALSTLGGGGTWDVGQGNILFRTPTHEFEYDENHRRTKKTDRATGAATSYEWDSRQRLRRARLPDGTVVTYMYDAFGRRVSKEILQAGVSVEPHVVRFLWDGTFLIADQDPVRGERIFVHDPFSYELLLQSDATGCYAYVIDPAGKPRELVDTAGHVTWRPTYSAWGKVIQVDRDAACARSDVSSPFRLLGHYWDEETGLAAAMHRYLDPDAARWLSPDPIGIRGGVNLFAYCGSPATDGDPLGLDFEGQKYDSSGNLTPEYYAYLRSRTPTDALRQQVNDDGAHGPDGRPIDPITGLPVNRLEADHIVPMKEITQMPGFNQLSEADQKALLNLDENFWGLGRSTNGSKSDQNHDEWRTYKGDPIEDDKVALLQKKDKAARAALAEELEAKLAKGAGKTTGS